MPRILPERTVEAWTTAYLTRWFPTAHLWAPTQRDPYSWDISGALPNGRHFVFEYKAVEGYRGPYVPIGPAQLDEYIDINDRLGRTFVWYVLPMWEYLTPPGCVLRCGGCSTNSAGQRPATVVAGRCEASRTSWRSAAGSTIPRRDVREPRMRKLFLRR